MTFNELVRRIRKEKGLTDEVPDFDPDNGNENARFLLLLQAPGRKAVQSGIISFTNPDPTARNLAAQLEESNVDRSDIAIWNIIPWYIGSSDMQKIRPTKAEDIEEGKKYLQRLLDSMPKLECVVLVGKKAQILYDYISAMTNAKVLKCWHTSGQAMNGHPERWKENVETFKSMYEG